MAVSHMKVNVIDQDKIDNIKLKYLKQQSDRAKYEAIDTVNAGNVQVQQYYTEFKNFYYSQKVTSECNDITFINVGSNPVTIEGAIVLQQNQTLVISGNANELNVTQYDVRFSVYEDPNNNLVVIRKLFR